MTDPTREEFDATLATIEARAETRFVELSGKIDRIADAIGALTSAVTTVRTEVREDGKFTRWTVGVTLIASLIAFAAALWVTEHTFRISGWFAAEIGTSSSISIRATSS